MEDIYHKWRELLSDDEKRKEWLDYYRQTDPVFHSVAEFCNHNEVADRLSLELAIIAILDAKVKTLSSEHQMAHFIKRPLPRKLEVDQHAYPEDYMDYK